MSPITFVRMRTLRKRMNELVPAQVHPQQRDARPPRTARASTSTASTQRWSATTAAQLWSDSSQSPVARRSTSTIPRALSKAARSSRSATPARNLVGEDESEPDQELAEEIEPSAGELTADGCGSGAQAVKSTVGRGGTEGFSMTEFSRQAIHQSGYLRAGFADEYDRFRPAPPAVLLDALARYAGSPEPARVVDLGSGTGLSTRAWADRADEVIGVEPNPEMRKVAERRTEQPNVRYVEAFANDTGLEPASADLVTCSQSFHWMERGPILAEAARILRPAVSSRRTTTTAVALIDPEVDAAFEAISSCGGDYRDEHKVEAGWTRTPKTGHLDAIRESGLFALHARVRRPRRDRSGSRRRSSASREASALCRNCWR